MGCSFVILGVVLSMWVALCCAACSNGAAGCATCLNTTTCATCSTTFRLSNGACVSCGVSNCNTCNATNCLTCATNYALVSPTSCIYKGPCSTGCNNCSAPTTCTICANGYALGSGVCTAATCSATATGTGKSNGNCTTVVQGRFCTFGCSTNFYSTAVVPSGVCRADAGPTASFASAPDVTCVQCPSCNASCSAHGTCNCGVCQCQTSNIIGVNCEYCKAGFAGASCTTACGCNAAGGTCNTTVGSSGHCLNCNANFAGQDCAACTCTSHGVCNDGLSGSGTCSSCLGNYFGTNCQTACTCVMGTCISGPSGTGKCSSCNDTNYAGQNCNTLCTCVGGTCKNGITGDGTCSSCNSGTLFGVNCDGSCTCEQGTCKNGITGDGHCSVCNTNTVFGTDCEKTCTCQNGVCNSGPTGNGHCSSCTAGSYFGTDCQQCTCLYGTCRNGVSGNGQCSSCNNTSYFGNNCDHLCTCKNGVCKSDVSGDGHCSSCSLNTVFGTDCDQPCSCKFGTCKSGVAGDGHCSSCSLNTVYGEDCDQPCTCVYGTCKSGVLGNGQCSSCNNTSYFGANCDQPCTCLNGICLNNVTGTGRCSSCTLNTVFGQDCNNSCTCQRGTCLSGVAGTGLCASCSGATFFGLNCEKDCTCVNGVCDSGPSGSGECSSCTGNWFGRNCTKPCTCVHGTCDNRPTGNGQCTFCDDGWFGQNCDKPCTCLAQNGVCNKGPTGNGFCSSCTGNTFGLNCTEPCTCLVSQGTCDKGPNGKGKCTTCSGNFYGENCEIVCDTRCDTRNGVCDNRARADAGNCTSCTNDLKAGPQCRIDCCIGGSCNNGISGDGTCRDCNPGKQANTTFLCSDCPPGTAKEGSNFNLCQKCPLGQANADYGKADCTDCVPGFLANVTGLLTCLPCSPGTSSTNGASICTDCEAGTYNGDYGAVCQPCQGDYFTAIAGKTECTYCGNGGKANSANTGCGPQQGYKPDPINALQWLQCPVREACCENLACGPSCDTTNSSVFYVGDLCQLCAPGAYSPNSDGRCEECPSFATVFIVVAAIALVIICILLVIVARSASFYFGSITVAYNFFQLVTILSSYNLQWPANVVQLFNLVSIFNFNLNIIHLDCLKAGGLDYVTKWQAKLALPVVLMAIFFIIFAVTYAWKKAVFIRKKCECGEKHINDLSDVEDDFDPSVKVVTATGAVADEKPDDDISYASFNAALSMMSVLYTLMITTSMEPFDCVKASTLPTATITTKNPERYVIHAGPLVDCYGDEWNRIYKLGIAGLVVYGLGVPLLFINLLVWNRNHLHRNHYIALFGMLYRRYKSNNYLWELLIMLRKVALVVPVFWGNLEGQLVVVIIAIFISAMAQLWRKPYSSSSVNKLETLSIVCSFIVLMAGLIFYELGGVNGANYLKGSSQQGARVFIGYVVVVLIVMFGFIIVIAVVLDVRELYLMKSRRAVGCYNTDQVKVHSHFFTSGMSIATPREYVTTTNHVDDIAIGYTSRATTKFTVTLEGTVHASETKYQFPALIERGDSQSSYYSETDDTEKEQKDCKLLIQHDRVAREYHLSMTFNHPGRYTLLLSGGRNLDELEKNGRCDKCGEYLKLAEPTPKYLVGKTKRLDWKSKKCCARARLLAFNPEHEHRLKHMLMEYVLRVTDDAGSEVIVPRGQVFVNTQKLARHGGILLKPTGKYLSVGETYPFRIRTYNASAVVVTETDINGKPVVGGTMRLISDDDIKHKENPLKRAIADGENPVHILGLNDYRRYLNGEETNWEKQWRKEIESKARERRITKALHNRQRGIDGRFYQLNFSGDVKILAPGFVTVTIYWKGPRPTFHVRRDDNGEKSVEYDVVFPPDKNEREFGRGRTRSRSDDASDDEGVSDERTEVKRSAQVLTFRATEKRNSAFSALSDFSEGFSEPMSDVVSLDQSKDDVDDAPPIESTTPRDQWRRWPGLTTAFDIADVAAASTLARQDVEVGSPVSSSSSSGE